MKLTVLGPGCWGLTLAWLLNDNFEDITIWGRECDLNEDLIINKHCSKPLEVQLDKKVVFTSDIKSAIEGADIILSVVATSGVRSVCEQLKSAGIKPSQPLVNASKGLELNSLMRMSEVIKDVLPEQKVVILSGPTLAKEVLLGKPTAASVACDDIETAEFVQKALDQRVERIKKYDSRYLEMIKENTLLISTDGYEVGQINGLTIITIGDYSFGKPSKITANTYLGKSGITNIEREIEISGPSHSKGVLILTGYLGEKFAQDFPLSLTASLCFEQLYNGVDGDSASSTEAYALLSSLSGIPINQSLAVTGSVNQKGEIQPIGGVNEKIEGFYQICKMRGFNKKHGVIIPIQNVRNLHLPDEIIESVKNGDFHIYAINTIDEGIELLTGVPAGKKNKDGTFPAGSINYLVYEKLKSYAEKSKLFE